MVEAIYALAVAASGPDGRIVQAINRAAANPNPTVRQATIVAVGYLEWPDLEGTLRVLGQDPDQDVQQLAASTLAALHEQG